MQVRPLYIFHGPPGSGKGTQAKLLAKSISAHIIATGDIIRMLIERKDTPREVKERYLNGDPQPDSLVIAEVKKQLARDLSDRPLIFDTFPLSIPQAEALEQLRKQYNLASPIVFYLDVSPESVLARINQRKICQDCEIAYYPKDSGYDSNRCRNCGGKIIVRSDDRPDVVEKRIQEYTQRTKQLKNYYRKKGQLVEINGEPKIQKVAQEIRKHLS